MKRTRVVHSSSSPAPAWLRLLTAIAASASLAWLAGCASAPIPKEEREAGPQTLSPGDTIVINFPAAPNLNVTQQIRRDGLINLATIGEIKAADRTPADLEKELSEKYAGELVSKEIKVTVAASSYAVYVGGAVLRPGKIVPARAITALEAIMEAGGFDTTKANPRKVHVLRYEGEKAKNFTLDLQRALDGKPTEPFYLKTNDIVTVPEKFIFF